MARATSLHAGCRVTGSHGPLMENPNPNIKRRVRQKVNGTVIRATGQRRWIVVFDFDGKEKEVTSASLKVATDSAEGIPLNETATGTDTESTAGTGLENNVSFPSFAMH